ncbi:MAG: hypothetical protein EOR30_04085 [Mesorhizobium sp.]|uniref:hypothetical protein n=1 Tax=unclassified Mesorhizobium TaxID=325217 RepID=UPI000FCB5C31|nr:MULTISPECIES: hypothetical protein [unclassified Mesorhizobium]RUV74843.1 hypothetical protein EOA78_07965 [Mesorhizobium sp. M5C.F.Cr.IN.023.01.1.1]RWF88651.1 MAG: hypothetical protein EOQ36_07405 [Mesorhizobium sp.]RWF92958.1 MAG: hypothetical protein EOQ45_19325 [Mesorhizobium sp.]RWI41282.1 MAG: hypothetical protein EOR14_09460 [Mesorhizobium sp.]RWI49726.1 MAG: hypothetical protein EOR15_11925 [Mesorhizobium sp.]
MSASLIFDIAPLGSLIAYSDGMPRPAARFTKKLAGWERRNGTGRLVRKEPARERPTYTSPPCFTLHEGTFGQNGIILVSVMRTYCIDSDLRFRVIERPRMGQVRVLQAMGDGEELLHLAESRDAAELWLARNGHHQARIEEVTADELSADAVEGRAAA